MGGCRAWTGGISTEVSLKSQARAGSWLGLSVAMFESVVSEMDSHVAEAELKLAK